MKFTINLTEKTTRHENGYKDTDRKVDMSIDMEDASIVDSTKALVDMLTNKELLGALLEYHKTEKTNRRCHCCSDDNGENMAEELHVDWSREGAFVETIRDLGTPWAMDNLRNKRSGMTDKHIYSLVSELAHCAVGWVTNKRTWVGVEDFSSRHGLDLTNLEVATVINGIYHAAKKSGFIK